MKKTTTKLVLKRETIRTLDRMQLEGIRGGGDDAAARADTGNGTGCPGVHAQEERRRLP
jgi:hypothetical protein